MRQFACQITFFEKFAVLIPLTIFFALLYSLFFFMPLCAILGPSGQCGDVIFPITKIVSWITRCVRQKKAGETVEPVGKWECVRFLTNMAGLTIAGETTVVGTKLDAAAGASGSSSGVAVGGIAAQKQTDDSGGVELTVANDDGAISTTRARQTRLI